MACAGMLHGYCKIIILIFMFLCWTTYLANLWHDNKMVYLFSSSTWAHFSVECDRLKESFLKLKYPQHLIDSTVSTFVTSMIIEQPSNSKNNEEKNVVRIVLSFKDQKSADKVRKQLRNLSHKIGHEIQLVFASKKIESQLKTCEKMPMIVNQQNVVYKSQCGMCDACCVGFTQCHIHQRIEEHKRPSSSIGFAHYLSFWKQKRNLKHWSFQNSKTLPF